MMRQIHPNVQAFQQFANLNVGDDYAVAAKFQTTFNTASLDYSTTKNITEILDLVITVLSFTAKNTPLVAAFINAIKTCEDIRILKDLDEAWEMIMAGCKGKSMGKLIKGNLDMRLKEINLYTQEALGGYPGHANHTQVAVKPYTGQAAHAQTAFKSIFGGAGPAHVDHAQRFLSGQSALATHTFGGMGFGQPAIPTHPFGIAGFGQPARLPMEPFGGAGFDRPEVDSVESLSRRLEVAKEAAERQRQNSVVATNTHHVQSLATATDSRFNVTEVKLTEALEVVAKLQSALATLNGKVDGLADDQATLTTKTAAVERANDKNALGISEVNARVDQSDAKMNRATESTNALMMQMMQAAEADREAAKADREAKEARRVTKEAERHAERLANKAAAERAAAARYAPTNSKAPATIRPAKAMNKKELAALAKAKALVAKHTPAEDAEEEEAEEPVFDKSDDEEELDLDTGRAIKKAKHG